MNSIIFNCIIQCIILITCIIIMFIEHDLNSKKEKIHFIISAIGAIFTFISFFLVNEVPAPVIERKSDYSAIILSSDEAMNIEYKISTNNSSNGQWIKYEKPFKLEKSAIIYAKASTLWYSSEQVYRDVYVAENGLVYFSSAEKPGDTIVNIKTEYNYNDPVINGDTGNHYIGYEIKKNDILVKGIDINGNEKEIKDFTYFPKILKSGKNVIEVEYSIADGMSVKSNLYVNGDNPAIIKLTADCIDSDIYTDTVLDNTYFKVKGTYEDGTLNDITDYSISPAKVKEGKNKVTITKNGLSTNVFINVIDKEKIAKHEEEVNDDIENANEIDVNVKYSGNLDEDGDLDYYKLCLNKKGKIIIKFTHPKMDKDGDFWIVSLFSQEENSRVEMKASGRNVETQSSPVRVTPGIYYIKISQDYYSDAKYIMTVLFIEENDSYEDEPNDDLSQAMTINLNKQYTGNLTNENDIDYYKFNIKNKKKVWINFKHDKTSEKETLWKISLFDDSDGTLLEFDSTGENANITSYNVRLPAGNYYIKINDYYWSDLDYTFCVYSKNEGIETENENNDDYGMATPITLDSSIIGNLQSENDVDFYKFKLKVKNSVKVTFIHNQIDNNNIFWRFELYSEKSSDTIIDNKNNATIEVNGNSSKISSVWNHLPAGTYYLKIFNYYYNNDDYIIKLS